MADDRIMPGFVIDCGAVFRVTVPHWTILIASCLHPLLLICQHLDISHCDRLTQNWLRHSVNFFSTIVLSAYSITPVSFVEKTAFTSLSCLYCFAVD